MKQEMQKPNSIRKMKVYRLHVQGDTCCSNDPSRDRVIRNGIKCSQGEHNCTQKLQNKEPMSALGQGEGPEERPGAEAGGMRWNIQTVPR